MSQDLNTSTYDEYVLLVDEYTPGSDPSTDLTAWCERAEAHLAEHPGGRYTVRIALDGQAAGTYGRRPSGSLQILGYSVECPEVVTAAFNTAWQVACETEQENSDDS